MLADSRTGSRPGRGADGSAARDDAAAGFLPPRFRYTTQTHGAAFGWERTKSGPCQPRSPFVSTLERNTRGELDIWIHSGPN